MGEERKIDKGRLLLILEKAFSGHNAVGFISLWPCPVTWLGILWFPPIIYDLHRVVFLSELIS